MMAPELSVADIQREVERLFQRPHRSDMIALFGNGDAGEITAAGRRWAVIPTRCEMEMRAAMPEMGRGADDHGRVFLVDWSSGRLPLDLSCRLAAGMMFHVSQDARLAGLFGARQTEPGLMRTGLAKVLLSGDVMGLKKVFGIVLTRHDATRHFLAAWAGFPLSEPFTAANLAAWCHRSAVGPSLMTKAAESDAWAQLGRELAEFVEQEGGPAAALVWQAFLHSTVRRFIQTAALAEAQLRSNDPVAKGVLQGRVTDLAPDIGPALLEAGHRISLHELVGQIVEPLDARELAALMEEAESLVPEEGFAVARDASPWLPAGHRARERALGEALGRLVDEPRWEALNGVRRALDQVASHALDPVSRTGPQRELRQMAMRLAAWLVEQAQQLPPGPGAAYQPAVDLATRYAEEGGYVDWCRGALRGPLPFAEELNDACHRVLKAADARRRDENQRFAAALLEWHAAGQPSRQVLPIGQVTRHLVADLVDGHPGRKALVVLMDGMSWAVANQILDRLADEQWAPVLWRPKGHANAAHLPPVLAEIPTLTQVSRAAFFAGKATAKDGNRSTQEDANRWSNNRWLVQANDDAALPELILRAQLMDGDSLRSEVRETINSDHAVVGVVVNAVDEELRGSTQVMRDFSKASIKPLAGLLSAAAGAERVVILASDHGHVLGEAMCPHGAPLAGDHERGRRWRSLGDGDPLHPFEMELPEKAWHPKGAPRVAAIWDEGVCHATPAYGEHGGLSLAEVVAPVLILAPEWLANLKMEGNSDLETRPAQAPGWWDLDVRPPRGAKPTEDRPAKKATETAVQVTLPMPDLEPPVEPGPATAAPEELPLLASLRASKIFKANVEGKDDSQVQSALGALGVLVAAGGSMGDREFARRCHERPHRVSAVVARMGAVLNIDGYAVVEHDRDGRQVRLNRARLVAQYGISE